MEPGKTLPPAALSFTEEMKGYVTFTGESAARDLMFHLDITVPDVDRFVRDPSHTATAEGTVRCDHLGGDCEVVAGTVNLLFDVRGPAYKLMRYHLFFVTPAGEAFTLSGIKQVRDDPGCDLWTDTSTLHTSIVRGHVPVQDIEASDLAASGLLYILARDFLEQLTTFKVDAPTALKRGAALASFGKFFLGSLWDVYVESKAA